MKHLTQNTKPKRHPWLAILLTQLGFPKTLTQRLSGLTDRQIRTIKLRQELTAKDRWETLRACNFTCVYCGRRPPEVKLHVDHKLALANGGTNHPSNRVAACSSCNLSKGSKML